MLYGVLVRVYHFNEGTIKHISPKGILPARNVPYLHGDERTRALRETV